MSPPRFLLRPALAALTVGVLSAALLAPGPAATASPPAAAAAAQAAGAVPQAGDRSAPSAARAPEPSTGATGTPATGTTPTGEVRGYVDGHSHLMSYEAFGGSLMCGKPFDERGIEAALKDCPDHEPYGIPAWFENFTRTGSPVGTHDTKGWPTFKDWPANDSFTHQQTYYKWVERSWRAGQRVMVNQLVANRTLCDIYPLKRNSCDEMDTIRLQAQRTRELQDHIDRENGGPGKGWFRIVTGPAEARKVIEAGKLAVVLGIETSEPFGCRQILGESQCTRAQIDQGLDEVKKLGVSSMFLCHKFDNALCGVRYDQGTTGVIMNLGNFVGSGRFWQADTCTGDAHDNPIQPSGGLGDLLAGPLRHLRLAGITLPVYPSAPHCNVNGLTELGEYALKGMIDRKMVVELDHMSVKAADRSLELLEKARYSGVVSSHSWTDSTFPRRIYALGGMITAYGSPAEGFVGEWRENKKLRDDRYVFGYGYGLDANGMGPLPAVRANNGGNPLRYPFTSPIDPGVTLDRQRTGERTWDVNTDGVANYGLVPDWIADIRNIAGGEITEDMARGAEAYLQMWGRART